MLRLDYSAITEQAADKDETDVTLSAVSLVLIMHILTLLSENQWLFVDAGEDERDITDNAIDEIFP